MSDHHITLIGREGCHLCDDAREVIEKVLAQMRDEPGSRNVVEVSIEGDAALRDMYGDQIPVVLIDGKVHNFWRIDAARLTAALTG
jgi:hypothetical protein